MFDKVLVVVGSDDPQLLALRRALQCVAAGGAIEVLDVVYEPLLEGYLGNKAIYEPLRSRVVRERQERVDALARAATGSHASVSGKALWAHPLHRVVAEHVAAHRVGLVVVGAGSEAIPSGLSHSLWQLVIGCPVPVLVVKGDSQSSYRHVVAAVDPFHAHAKPAALDAEIVRHAKAVQALTGAALTVLHCYTPLEYFGADLLDLPAHDPRFVAGREEALQTLCRDAGIGARAARLVAGPPHAVLQRLQQSGEADLVVMGALARGRLAELVVGSTAERLLHHGRGDILIVKLPGAG